MERSKWTCGANVAVIRDSEFLIELFEDGDILVAELFGLEALRGGSVGHLLNVDVVVQGEYVR